MLLEALSIHDRTLWLSKLSEAISQFREKDQQQKIKKESGMCTELNDIEVARFTILSLPWFEAYVNLHWYFYYLLDICC